jgi:hypothetical protein
VLFLDSDRKNISVLTEMGLLPSASCAILFTVPFAFKRMLRKCVKIFAVITAMLGVYAIPKYLGPSFNTPISEYVISGKSIEANGCRIEFHPPNNLDTTQSCFFPQSFYEAAQPGDIIRMSTGSGCGGYRCLVREGRVVTHARSFSSDQCHVILFIVAAFFPLLVFFRLENELLRSLILAAAILAEMIVLGVILFYGLLLYAILNSHNC